MATLIVREGGGAGTQHPLDGELVAGREQGAADLVLADSGVSRRHAVFRADAGVVTVEDLGSSNGTFVNGAPVSGAVELFNGDEIQLGATVLQLEGADTATALLPPRPDPNQRHPAAAPRPQPPSSPAPSPPAPPPRQQPSATPRRLGPHPHDESNIPALAAVFLGPLSILLLLFSSGAAFFVSLPCAIGAIVLGKMGMRRVDRGESDGHRALARLGSVTGIVGAVLSLLALVAFVLVVTLLDATEESLSDIVDRVREEIEGVDVPDVPDTPEVNPPEVQPPDSGGGEAGGVAPP